MGFMADYKKTYEILTGLKLRWRGTFGFYYPRQRANDRYWTRKFLGTDKEWQYRDPESFVWALRMLHRCLHDPTLKMIKDEGLGDFSELVEYEGEPEDFETGTESWHELSYPEGNIGEFGEEAIERIPERTASRLPLYVPEDDDGEDEGQMPEGSWDELWQEIYRCRKEEEEEEREGLPSSFGELFWKMHWY
jgi:hypothetical protein